MNLQDMTLQQLKEIVDGAPEGATHYDYKRYKRKASFGSFVDYLKYDETGMNQFINDEGEWEIGGEFHTHEDLGYIKLSDILTRIAELELVFKVGDWVVFDDQESPLHPTFKSIFEIDAVYTRIVTVNFAGTLSISKDDIRHATIKEIAAGCRIDQTESHFQSALSRAKAHIAGLPEWQRQGLNDAMNAGHRIYEPLANMQNIIDIVNLEQYKDDELTRFKNDIKYPVEPYEDVAELIVCAANRDPESGKVYLCVRHGCEMFWQQIDSEYGEDFCCQNFEEGFYTNHLRFVCREDAYIIANDNGQIKRLCPTNSNRLYSEMLY